MRIAVMGDIHSNHIALEACMQWVYRNNIDGIAFLGDYISDCPYPQKTMRILRNIPEVFMTWFVRGNREDYMLDHRHNLTDEWRRSSQSGSLLYTYQNLSGSDLRFFEAMPIGMEVKLDGYPPFSICHATMQSNRRLLYSDSPDMPKFFEEFATELLVCGHCHEAYVRSQGGRTIVNAGTVGNPVHGQRGATLVLLESDGGSWRFEHINVPYDRQAVIDEFTESGLIYFADVWSRAYIAALKTGINYSYECVKLVERYCEETGEDFSCEELWQRAADELGI